MNAPLSREEKRSRRRVFAQWLVSIDDPLIPIRTRVDIDRRFREWSRRTPGYTITFAAGVASTLIRSLPDADPWRRPGPDFGTYRDAEDVIPMPPEDDELWGRGQMLLDLQLAPLADPMPPGAGRVFGACAQGVEEGQFAFTEAREALQVRKEALSADIAQAIIMWARWRRKLYLRDGDGYPLANGFAWLGFAEEIEDGRPVPHDEIDVSVIADRLPDEMYWNIFIPEDERG